LSENEFSERNETQKIQNAQFFPKNIKTLKGEEVKSVVVIE